MPTTTRGYRFPAGSDPPNGPLAVQNLALDVDANPGIMAGNTATRDALTGSLLWEGRLFYNISLHRYERFDGASWQAFNAADLMTTKGDIPIATAPGVLARHGVGSNGTGLIADSTKPDGWGNGFLRTVGCRAYRATNRTVGNASVVPINFDTNSFDTDSFHSTSTNTSRITIPIAGTYIVTASVLWDTNGAGIRELELAKNGSSNAEAFDRIPAPPSSRVSNRFTRLTQAGIGDYFEVMAYQDSGSSLDIIGGGSEARIGVSGMCVFGAVLLGT